MVGRAVEFLLAHPDPNATTTAVVTRLTGLRDRLAELARIHFAAQRAVAEAVSHKAELREGLEQQIAALRGLAVTAAATEPGLRIHLRPFRRSLSESAFLAIARVAVAEALNRKDALMALGMPAALLESIATDLDQFEAAISRQQQSLNAQVGAAAEMKLVARDIMGVIRHFDALHKLRFRKDPELLAAWRSARNVEWPGGESGGTTAPPVEGTTAA
jgi:hypothetical protein